MRFFNTTNAPARQWIRQSTGFSYVTMIAHVGGIPYATGFADLKTWVIRTTAPKRVTVVQLSSYVTNGVSCEHFAIGHTMIP